MHSLGIEQITLALLVPGLEQDSHSFFLSILYFGHKSLDYAYNQTCRLSKNTAFDTTKAHMCYRKFHPCPSDSTPLH